MIRILVCVVFFRISFAWAQLDSPVVLLTIPKSGSHLMIKALYLMSSTPPIWHTHLNTLPKQKILYSHFCVSPELERSYQKFPNLKKIINIRDLRDVCVSTVHHIQKTHWPGLSAADRKIFKQLSFEDQLLFVMNYECDMRKNILQVSIRAVAEQALLYSRDPEHLVCRYEDLVGPLGGGSRESQKQELIRIAGYLEYSITEEEIDAIASKLYGDEENVFTSVIHNFYSTFHQGKIGSWKLFFTEKHKSSFKEKLGDVLIALGYEKDDDW